MDRVGGWCKTELYGARRPVDREIVLERRAEFRLRSRERRNCAPYSARASPRVGAKGKKEERIEGKKETSKDRIWISIWCGECERRIGCKEKW